MKLTSNVFSILPAPDGEPLETVSIRIKIALINNRKAMSIIQVMNELNNDGHRKVNRKEVLSRLSDLVCREEINRIAKGVYSFYRRDELGY